MFPNTHRLRRLLDYLSIHPEPLLLSLDEFRKKEENNEKLSQSTLEKIDLIRKTVYQGNNYKQLGLFEFYLGLVMMEFGWFSEAAESFRKANEHWGLYKERPLACLANFAKGVAFHKSREFVEASKIYKEVEYQIKVISDEVNKLPPPNLPEITKYKEFVNDLMAQLQIVQTNITEEVLEDISPRIDPRLQTGSQDHSSR